MKWKKILLIDTKETDRHKHGDTHTVSTGPLRLFSYGERVGAAEKLLVELVYDKYCNGLFQGKKTVLYKPGFSPVSNRFRLINMFKLEV